MKYLSFIVALSLAFSAGAASPDYKSFRGTGGISVTTNPPTGTVVIDGSGVSGSSNFVTAAFGSATVTNGAYLGQQGIQGSLYAYETTANANRRVLTMSPSGYIWGTTDVAHVFLGPAVRPGIDDTTAFGSSATRWKGAFFKDVVQVDGSVNVSTNVNANAAVITNNLSVLGTQTNAGGANFAAGVTNWGAVHNRSSVTNQGQTDMAGASATNLSISENISDYKTAAPNRALTATNENGATAWRGAFPTSFRHKRVAWVGLYNSAGFIFEQVGENIASASAPVMHGAATNAPARATMTTSATTNAQAGLQPQAPGRTNYFPGKNIYWEWAGRFTETNSGFKFFAGLNSDGNIGTVATNDSHATRHSAMFRASTTVPETTWKFITSDGTTQTTTDTTVLADTNRVILEIVEDYQNLRWYGRINGVVRATNTATLPAGPMHTWVTVANITNANTHTVYHEALYSEQDHR